MDNKAACLIIIIISIIIIIIIMNVCLRTLDELYCNSFPLMTKFIAKKRFQ